MNRFKKELRRKGIKLECDYLWLPFEVSKNIYLEDVYVDSQRATWTEFYNVIDERYQLNRDGTISEIVPNYGQPFC